MHLLRPSEKPVQHWCSCTKVLTAARAGCRSAAKCSDWFRADSSYSGTAQHTSFVHTPGACAREALVTFILKVHLHLAILSFLADFCSTSTYLMSATLRAKLVPKVLELVVGENCCNLQWLRKWHRVINVVVISVYLLCQRKTNRFSEKGSTATLLLRREG